MRMRVLGRPRSGAWLALAGVVGLLAAVATVRAGGEPAPEGAIVVARQELRPGLVIDSELATTALVAVPAPLMPGVRGLLADPASAVGRRVGVPVAAGEPLTDAVLGGAPGTGPAPLGAGERAVPVPLSAAGAAVGLAAGARVDVVASTGEGPAGRTAVVVADAEVLAVAGAPPEDGIGASGEALLRVTSVQALRITAALNFAREVRLLARPGDEIGVAPGPRSVDAP